MDVNSFLDPEVGTVSHGAEVVRLGTVTYGATAGRQTCRGCHYALTWQDLYWYFLTSTEVNPQAYGITVVVFSQKYSGYRISTGNGGTSSS